MIHTSEKLRGFVVSSSAISEDLRLDASFYTQDVVMAKQTLQNSKYPITKMSEFCEDIFTLARFKRIWIPDEKNGFPYLSASDITNFKPFRTRYVSKNTVSKPYLHFVREGWILLTSSGTVGIPIYVGKNLTRYFLTHDLIRIIPRTNNLSGYIYAYLSSRIGKALVSKDHYGGVVDHIEAHHVKEIPIPKIDSDLMAEINAKVVKAWKLREEALELETEAIHDLEGLLEQNNENS